MLSFCFNSVSMTMVQKPLKTEREQSGLFQFSFFVDGQNEGMSWSERTQEPMKTMFHRIQKVSFGLTPSAILFGYTRRIPET